MKPMDGPEDIMENPSEHTITTSQEPSHGLETDAPWAMGSGLKWELNVITGFIVAGGLAILILLDFLSMRQVLYNERTQHLREVSELVLEMAGGAGSVAEIQRVVHTVGHRLNGPRFPDHRIVVAGADGRILAGLPETLVGEQLSESGVRPESRVLQVTRSLPLPEGLGTGSLKIYLSLDAVRQQLLQSVSYHLLAILLVLALVFVSIRYVLSSRVIQPIEKLVEAMGRMERGTWRLSLEIPSRNEIGWLTASFLQMGKRLESTVRQLVRAEKVASAAMVAIRVKRELAEPIRSLKKGLKYFEITWAEKAPGDRRVTQQLMADVDRMEEAVHRLAEIEEAAMGKESAPHPEGGAKRG